MHSPSLMLPHEIPRLNLELSPSLLTGHCSGGPQRGGKEHGRQPTGQVCVGMGGGTILKELLQAPQRPCSSQTRPHAPPPLLPFPCLSPPPPPPPGSTSHRAEASSWTAAPPGHSASVSGLRSGWRVEGSSTCCRMGDVEAPPPPLPALSLPSPPPPSAPHPCPLPLQASGRGPWPWWGRSRCCSAAPSGRTSPTGSGEKRRRR